MYNGAYQNSEYISERPAHYALLQASLGTGPGAAALEDVPQLHQPVMARRNQVPTTYFYPEGPMTSRTPYIQPQFQYPQPPQHAQTRDTSQNMLMENVAVKDR